MGSEKLTRRRGELQWVATQKRSRFIYNANIR